MRSAPSTYGYVDVGRLAPRNPLWRNVVLYDRLIASLPAQSAMPGSAATEATLPGVPSPPLTRADLSLASQRARLEQVRSRELSELSVRLDDARRYRLNVEAYAWRREQSVKTDADIQRINTEYQATVDKAMTMANVRLVNLQLEIAALKQTLANEAALVKEPGAGAPALDQARADLAAKTQELAAATEAQNAALAALAKEHEQKLAGALREGASAVELLRVARDAEYREADAREVKTAGSRLQARMDSVLEEVASAENRTWIQSTSPPAKNLAYRWPQPATGVLQMLRQRELDRLRAQRRQWVDYILVNTRLAVAQVAADRHWNVAVESGRHAPGRTAVKDLTPQVAAALSDGVWKVNG